MLGTLIKKEITETILDLRFVVSTLLCLVLIPLGMYVSLRNYEQRLQEYQTAVQQYERRNEGRMSSAEFAAEGYRPPSPLSVFSHGLEDKLNLKVTTQYDGNYRIEIISGNENAQAVLFGRVDFVYITSTVLSLLALIFTFRTVTGEKESGTLRLIVGGSIPRGKIILSKIVGNYLVFLIPLLLSFLVSLLVLSSSDALSLFTSPHVVTIFLLLVVTLLFLFCIFSMGTLVSVLTHNSIVSMIDTLFVWVLLALVVPKISPMIAEAVRPVLPRQVIDTEKAMVRAQLEETQKKKEADLYRQVLAETGVTVDRAFDDSEQAERARDIYDGRKAPIERKYQERIHEETRRIEDDYTNRRRAQAILAANLSRISPVCCFTYALSELSSTGTAETDNFSRRAQQFQETVKLNHYENFEYKRYGLANGNRTRWSAGFTRKEGYDPSNVSIPQMSNYRHTSLAGALSVCWVDIVLLLLFTVLFFAGAFVMFLRYDVR